MGDGWDSHAVSWVNESGSARRSGSPAAHAAAGLAWVAKGTVWLSWGAWFRKRLDIYGPITKGGKARHGGMNGVRGEGVCVEWSEGRARMGECVGE